ncbi:hypothetical protein DL766_001735 [Monosporascus sp. MC13-8B]|uniref:Aromatic prenyltransferase n=1 Tax=Monosporascus cannonballus TaxID=155416 RepID=A0ABY0H6S9_9PEZI|nr:hypothetical protein DL762_005928 [Monosporascus cannonballus]RYO91141.1 hypothetical protein DL763_005089 [Monosporascus cannonballus]RYP36978.1 hypothetical protein DL766_001735 [Monosporascus sp. MC13-8B]
MDFVTPMSEATSRSADHQYWSSCLVPKFQAYIRQNGSYTEQQAADHVKAFDCMLSVLGPRLPHPHTGALLTHQGIPVEFSTNLCDKRQPIMRFELEPLDAQTGSPSDPFGEGCLSSSFATVAGAMNTPADRRWSDQLRTAFALSADEKRIANSRMPPHMDRISLGYFGIGLDGDKRTMKFYTSHMAKYLGGEKTALSSDAFSTSTTGRASTPRRPRYSRPSIAAPPPKARVKLYGRTHSTAFSSVRDIVTLGGRAVTEETEESLRRLRSIWHLLLNDPRIRDDDNYDRPPLDAKFYRKGLLVSFEVSTVNPNPEVKVYVPFFQYHGNDAECARNLEQACTLLNWDWGHGKYLKMLETLLSPTCMIAQPLNDSAG